MQALDHGIEHGVWIDIKTVMLFCEPGEIALVGTLYFSEPMHELTIIRQRYKAFKL